ncbi:MAG: response regulator [Methanothrix sp.]|jgi:two-component system response regulator YesN|nr:response regulator [Methanothrix sp.]
MKNLLIVDDEQAIRSIIADYLADFRNDLAIHTAENGRKAVEIMESCNVDLLITDITMPVMDGIALLQYAANRKPGLPVIVMSGRCNQEALGSIEGLGPRHFVAKPFVFKDLSSRVADLIQA